MAGVIATFAVAAAGVAAQAADAPPGPTIVYGTPPVEPLLPPVGYVLDPSDARRPIYVVNQGPVYSGPSIITYPGYFEALAWPRFYPYVSADYGYPWYANPYYRRAHHGHYYSHYRPAFGPCCR